MQGGHSLQDSLRIIILTRSKDATDTAWANEMNWNCFGLLFEHYNSASTPKRLQKLNGCRGRPPDIPDLSHSIPVQHNGTFAMRNLSSLKMESVKTATAYFWSDSWHFLSIYINTLLQLRLESPPEIKPTIVILEIQESKALQDNFDALETLWKTIFRDWGPVVCSASTNCMMLWFSSYHVFRSTGLASLIALHQLLGTSGHECFFGPTKLHGALLSSSISSTLVEGVSSSFNLQWCPRCCQRNDCNINWYSADFVLTPHSWK